MRRKGKVRKIAAGSLGVISEENKRNNYEIKTLALIWEKVSI